MVNYLTSNGRDTQDTYAGLSPENNQIYLRNKAKARKLHEALKQGDPNCKIPPNDLGRLACSIHADQLIGLRTISEKQIK